MPKENSLPNFTVEEPEDNSITLQDVLDGPPPDRDYISESVEKLLVAQLFGEIKLKPNQVTALNTLSRKFIEQAATLKDDIEPIDHQAVLTEALNSNSSDFLTLTQVAEKYFETEKERRASLDKGIEDQANEINEDSHIPDLTADGQLNPEEILDGLIRPEKDGGEAASPGIDISSQGNSGFAEISLLQGDGVQPPQVSTGLPHLSR